jgi:amino acid transporter
MSYVEVFATRHSATSLGSITAPVTVIASLYHVTFFRIPVCLGAMVSFFSLTLSCLNAGARIAFPLGRHGYLPKVMHRVHATNRTPHAALGIYGGLILTVALVLHATGTGAVTMFDDAGTLAAFGFLLAYFMISVAAPFYLRKLGELRGRHVVVAVLAVTCLLVPTVGSFYPAPPSPINLFPYIFVGYLVVGAAWLFVLNRRAPGTIAGIETDLEKTLEASIAGELDGASDLAPAHGFGFAAAPTGAGMVAASTKPE